MKVALGVIAIKVAAERAIAAIEAHRAAADAEFLAPFAVGHTGFLWWRKPFKRTKEQQIAAAKWRYSWTPLPNFPSTAYANQMQRCQVLLGVASHKATGTILDVDGEDLSSIALHLEPYESERI